GAGGNWATTFRLRSPDGGALRPLTPLRVWQTSLGFVLSSGAFTGSTCKVSTTASPSRLTSPGPLNRGGKSELANLVHPTTAAGYRHKPRYVSPARTRAIGGARAPEGCTPRCS